MDGLVDLVCNAIYAFNTAQYKRSLVQLVKKALSFRFVGRKSVFNVVFDGNWDAGCNACGSSSPQYWHSTWFICSYVGYETMDTKNRRSHGSIKARLRPASESDLGNSAALTNWPIVPTAKKGFVETGRL